GHHDIGFVAGPRSSWSSRERLGGMRTATASQGVRLVELGHFSPTYEGGRDAAAGVVASGATAVVAYNDLCAIGLMSALRERGVEVPKDLSVVGIDDIEMSAMLHPALTTVDVPKADLGRTAVDFLLRALADPASRPRHVALTTRLVVRNTTAPPPVSVRHVRRPVAQRLGAS
ncbi:MAG: substrate-binding domain-containing protein, partial [Terracoccus sp.]